MRHLLFACTCLIAQACLAQTDGSGNASVHRCVVDGQRVFQQAPCNEAQPRVRDEMRERQRVAAFEREQANVLRQQQEKEKQRLLSEQDTKRRLDDEKEAARLKKHCGGNYMELKVGMSEDQVLNCTEWRSPTTVNISKNAAGIQKQYVFDLFGRSYLYFRNGILTSIQY